MKKRNYLLFMMTVALSCIAVSCEKDPYLGRGRYIYNDGCFNEVITPEEAAQEILSSMVYVQGGTFQMGATSEQGSDAYSDEMPVHTVTVSSFYMGATEVTQKQWTAIMGSNPSRFKGDNLPVENVSWNDCQEFITKLNQLTGITFRLPTEAEWEYAARGGIHHSGYKYAGSNRVGDVAWYSGNSSSGTHPVGTKQPNALGLYDMSGNVYEWCQDWYGSYSSATQTDPAGPSSGSYRVLRGGGWYSLAWYCRVSCRYNRVPDYRSYYFGFRLSLVVTDTETLPTVTTAPVSNITNTTATLNGSVTNQGGSWVESRGFCWSASSNPTLDNCLGQTSVGNGTGDFSYNVSGLSAGTTYYVRAWATNSAGTAYGQAQSFQTENGYDCVQEILSSMVYVQGGTFQMGGTSEQGSDAESDEMPVHTVTVSSFYMGATEVTQKQWTAIMGSNPSYYQGDNLPVENVSWNDCQEFITKLNQLTGRTFRLPTEAEWEYAARGGIHHSGYKYAGSNSVGDVAWYSGNSSNGTHPVGTKQPNALGLYDMSGNVWEWCQDWYGSYGSGAQTNPQGPSSGSDRVLRGGSWVNLAGRCRVSYRGSHYPGICGSYYGFRLSLVP